MSPSEVLWSSKVWNPGVRRERFWTVKSASMVAESLGRKDGKENLVVIPSLRTRLKLSVRMKLEPGRESFWGLSRKREGTARVEESAGIGVDVGSGVGVFVGTGDTIPPEFFPALSQVALP